MYPPLPTDFTGTVGRNFQDVKLAWGVRRDRGFGHAITLAVYFEELNWWLAVLGHDASNGRGSLLTDETEILFTLHAFCKRANGLVNNNRLMLVNVHPPVAGEYGPELEQYTQLMDQHLKLNPLEGFRVTAWD